MYGEVIIYHLYKTYVVYTSKSSRMMSMGKERKYFYLNNNKVINNENQIKDQPFDLEDWGMLPSFRKIEYQKEVLESIPDLNTRPFSQSKNNIVDYKDFFGHDDIHYYIKHIEKLNGIGFYKILPYGHHEYYNF